jgi:hypothetical protein
MVHKDQIYLPRCLLLMLAIKTAFCAVNNEQTTFSSPNQSSTLFIPNRYLREVFFFLSENATVESLRTILDKLFEFDDYCGGENIYCAVQCKSEKFQAENLLCHNSASIGCSMRNSFSSLYNNSASYLQQCRIHHDDVNNVFSKLLFRMSEMMQNDHLSLRGPPPYTNFMTQVILISDYPVGSFEIGDNIFNTLKAQQNITFIALTTNLSNVTAHQYFPNDTWNSFPDFMNWTPDGGSNPICGYKSHPYSMFCNGLAQNSVFSLYSENRVRAFSNSQIGSGSSPFLSQTFSKFDEYCVVFDAEHESSIRIAKLGLIKKILAKFVFMDPFQDGIFANFYLKPNLYFL